MVTWNVDECRVCVLERGNDVALALADRVCQLATACASEGRAPVLGFAAGATPRGTYHALELRRRTGQLDLGRAMAFALNELYPINPAADQSVARELSQVAADIGIPDRRLSLLRGDLPRERIAQHCAEFEEQIRRAGGIDLQLLGVGRNGHVGLNEPGSNPRSRTRLVGLSELTRHDAALRFGGIERTPARAITMGLGTIFEAREIALLAIGVHKAPIVKRVLEEKPSEHLPASLLRLHARATFYLDEAAASLLAPRATADSGCAPPPDRPREALR